jgi:pimeloyl-ACP methyl ester carboxylesterase
MSQEIVTSKDGTRIACFRSGEGPPLVLVHGTAADHGRWRPVLPAFEERFTVCAVDRRGRGGSGDSDDYAIEREFEDVAAVVDSLGEPVNLLGHSYGALCALEASRYRQDPNFEGFETTAQRACRPRCFARVHAMKLAPARRLSGESAAPIRP